MSPTFLFACQILLLLDQALLEFLESKIRFNKDQEDSLC